MRSIGCGGMLAWMSAVVLYLSPGVALANSSSHSSSGGGGGSHSSSGGGHSSSSSHSSSGHSSSSHSSSSHTSSGHSSSNHSSRSHSSSGRSSANQSLSSHHSTHRRPSRGHKPGHHKRGVRRHRRFHFRRTATPVSGCVSQPATAATTSPGQTKQKRRVLRNDCNTVKKPARTKPPSAPVPPATTSS